MSEAPSSGENYAASPEGFGDATFPVPVTPSVGRSRAMRGEERVTDYRAAVSAAAAGVAADTGCEG